MASTISGARKSKLIKPQGSVGFLLNVWTASSGPPTAEMLDPLNYAQREAQPSLRSADVTNEEDTEVAFVLGRYMVKTAVGTVVERFGRGGSRWGLRWKD
jgi:hypothetical protein